MLMRQASCATFCRSKLCLAAGAVQGGHISLLIIGCILMSCTLKLSSHGILCAAGGPQEGTNPKAISSAPSCVHVSAHGTAQNVLC